MNDPQDNGEPAQELRSVIGCAPDAVVDAAVQILVADFSGDGSAEVVAAARAFLVREFEEWTAPKSEPAAPSDSLP